MVYLVLSSADHFQISLSRYVTVSIHGGQDRSCLIKNILTTSAASSTNLRSIVIFASCVLHRSLDFGKFQVFVSQNPIQDDIVFQYSSCMTLVQENSSRVPACSIVRYLLLYFALPTAVLCATYCCIVHTAVLCAVKSLNSGQGGQSCPVVWCASCTAPHPRSRDVFRVPIAIPGGGHGKKNQAL